VPIQKAEATELRPKTIRRIPSRIARNAFPPSSPIRLKLAVTVSQRGRGVTVMPGLSTLIPLQLEMNQPDVRIEGVAADNSGEW
jgi:hypothetical protein